MSLTRYALRTAGLAALYLLATSAGLATAQTTGGVRLLWPAAVVGALWLVAQARGGRRNLDVIALSVAAVLAPGHAPGHGDGLLHAFVQAVPQVVPAVLFAWLFDRRLPGYWLGHGDRFRTPGRSLARLAGVAFSAALAAAVLLKVVDTDLGLPEAGYVVVRDATALMLAVLTARGVRGRALRRGQERPGGAVDAGRKGGRDEGPRGPGLTLVK